MDNNEAATKIQVSSTVAEQDSHLTKSSFLLQPLLLATPYFSFLRISFCLSDRSFISCLTASTFSVVQGDTI